MLGDWLSTCASEAGSMLRHHPIARIIPPTSRRRTFGLRVARRGVYAALICVVWLSMAAVAQPEKPRGRSSKALPTPHGYTSPAARQLTFIGDNGEAYFSPDGKQLIFQSRKRPQHWSTQIYMLDLLSGAERRISKNSGDDTCSYFQPGMQRIIYASTFDEIAENPAMRQFTPAARRAKEEAERQAGKRRRYRWDFLPYEIYSANLDGSGIRRLTNSPGYDAEGTFSRDGKKIIFTSNRDGDLELYTMNADGSDQRRVTRAKGYDGGAFFSPDARKIVWRAFRGDWRQAQVFIANADGSGEQQFTNDAAINWAPFFHPSGATIIYSANRDGRRNFELYLLTDLSHSDGPCIKRLTYHESADVLPVFSPDGKKIVWTSKRDGHNNLYMMDFVEPQSCINR